MGAEGAVIDGSRELTDFTTQNGLHVASGQTQEGLRIATDQGSDGFDRAGYPETLFIDGKPLTPVDNIGEVTSGKFYFDYGADKIYFADDPSGHKVEAGYAAAAFDSDAAGVTISNLTIEQFNSPTQHGAVQGGENWTVSNNEVRLNYGVGVTVQGESTVSGNYVHDNGEMGIGGNGDNIVLQGNEIASNGYWSGIDPMWEGGGTKFALTNNLLVKDNYSHDNNGLGLWTDIDNIHTTYEGNLVVNNLNGGISHEISYDAVIRDNTLIGNGAALAGGGWLWGGQIQIQNSGNVEVYNNNIDMSGGVNGIALIQQDRGSGAYGEHTTTGNNIHDNTIVSTTGDGLTGGVADHDEDGMLNGDNTFAGNHYYMSDGDHWRWGDFPSGDDWDAYISDSGQDDGATLQSSSAIDTSGWLVDFSDTGSSVELPSGDIDLSTPVAGEKPGSDGLVGAPGAGSDDLSTPVFGDDGRTDHHVAPPVVGIKLRGTAGADELIGTAGDDHIFGRGGEDTIFGGQGNDVLHGGGKSDVFIFEFQDGDDTIIGFNHSRHHDNIILPDDYFSSGQEILAAARDEGNDTVIEYGDNHLTLKGVHVSDLSADFFSVQ